MIFTFSFVLAKILFCDYAISKKKSYKNIWQNLSFWLVESFLPRIRHEREWLLHGRDLEWEMAKPFPNFWDWEWEWKFNSQILGLGLGMKKNVSNPTWEQIAKNSHSCQLC